MIESKYPEIKEKIEDGIRNGRWSKKLPGVMALARQFGVNHQTVIKSVRLLQEEGKVIVKGTSGTYVSPRSPKRPKTRIIGVVGMITQENTIHPASNIIEKIAEEQDYRLLYLDSMKGHPDIFEVLLDSIAVDGYLFSSSTLNQKIAKKLNLQGIPFICTNRMENGIPWVDFNIEKTIASGIDYFYNKGLSRIVFAGLKFKTGKERQVTAFKQAVREKNIAEKSFYHEYDLESPLTVDRDKCYTKASNEIIDFIKKLGFLPEAVIIPHRIIAEKIYLHYQKKNLLIPFIYYTEDRKSTIITRKGCAYVAIPSDQRLSAAINMLFSLMKNPGIAPENQLIEMPLTPIK